MAHKINTGNVLAGLPPAGQPEELIEQLAAEDAASPVRIERIVSHGHVTPDGEWYDQDQDEWVLVLQGAARLSFEDRPDLALTAGEYVNIPAHVRHRVSWTRPDTPTVWLAVFY